MRKTASLGIALLFFLVLAVTPEVRAEEGDGALILTSGRRVVGHLVRDEVTGDVTVVRPVGRITYRRNEYSRIEWEGSTPANPTTNPANPTTNPASPTTNPANPVESQEPRQLSDILLRDGRVLRGWFENRGTTYVIHYISGAVEATIEVPTGDIVNVTAVQEETTAQVVERENFVDFEAGYAIDRLDANWRFVPEPIEPLLRVLLVRGNDEAYLAVKVEPLTERFRPFAVPATDQLAGRFASEVQPRLLEENEQIANVQGSPVELLSTTAYRLRYRARPLGETTDYEVNELRLLREVSRGEGWQYIVKGYAPVARYAALAAEIERAQRRLALLGQLELTSDAYADLAAGFAIRCPNPEWRLDTKIYPDDPALRCEMLIPSPNASVRVFVSPAEANATAEAWLARVASERRETVRFFREQSRSVRNDLGIPVADLSYEGYVGSETQTRVFRLLLCIANGQAVQVESVVSSAAEAAAARQGIEDALGTFRVFNREALSAWLDTQGRAMREMRAGYQSATQSRWPDAIAAYTRAIELFPRYAAAYFLRAKSYRENRQFSLVRRDLDVLEGLAPKPEHRELMAQVYFDEAEAVLAERTPRFEEAERTFVRALRASEGTPLNARVRAGLEERLYPAWWSQIQQDSNAAQAAVRAPTETTPEAQDQYVNRQQAARRRVLGTAEEIVERGERLLRSRRMRELWLAVLNVVSGTHQAEHPRAFGDEKRVVRRMIRLAEEWELEDQVRVNRQRLEQIDREEHAFREQQRNSR